MGHHSTQGRQDGDVSAGEAVTPWGTPLGHQVQTTTHNNLQSLPDPGKQGPRLPTSTGGPGRSPGAPHREHEGCRPASRGLSLTLMTFSGRLRELLARFQ